eukprot:Unigene6302_Nuclearia_a/m.19404 Unigene6302_Nuclearia_a/g.19404  ORF Unigene6302_Nuclearia_a/g.19404 Unigene6302_Nuclearia_a/m.19404 type:complete len:323 (+) Unigene6302_Nuclearia_a:2111-3079(+)
MRSSTGTDVFHKTMTKYLYPLSRTSSTWHERSTAIMRAQMCTRPLRCSTAGDCSSLSTYGKMPTESARLAAHAPRSRNCASSRSARSRCAWLSSTCSTMGSCSGCCFRSCPCSSQTSNAVSCSAKNVLGTYWCVPASMRGSWPRHTSIARSHIFHIGCWYVGGSLGDDSGVQLYERMMRSASRKLRNSDATSRSWRNSFWNRSRGSTFHAIVSVIAVKIQLSSPRGVRRSLSRPGILSTTSSERLLRIELCSTNQRRAISIGVVRHDVNRSAGRSGFIGRISLAPHAASWIESRTGSTCWLVELGLLACSRSYSFSRCSANW